MEERSISGALDPRRNQSLERKKLYEVMLLTEIPGTARPNEPMHAVLEDALAETNTAENEGQHVRNHALIHYLATLATSNDTKDTFDFDFVESLLNNGADINSKDKTGQTVFHEVARSWNVDVASFLIKHGANINQQDDFGRSPLHVAAAVDYAEMVEFLLQNGADIAIKTKGEEQTPVHFAAKNDAVNSLHMLLGYGANIDARDSKNRTPLQVSAEMNRSKAAKLLINEGAPSGVYDNLGNCALSLLIEKIPEVALEAMDQFHSTDIINRKEFYFLNYLEASKLKQHKTPARTPLEIAVQNERFDVILHPVMQRLIGAKWQMYGKRGAILDLVINLFYSILWTVLGVTLPKYGRDLYLPIAENSWRLTIGVILVLLTGLEIRKQVTNTLKTRQELKKWKEWRAAELEPDLQYCHPRWPQETQYLKAEIKAVRNLSLISGSDMWIYFDWVALVFILATIISHVTFFHYSTATSKDVHHYIIIPLLMILWLRIFKYARPFESAGPFVVIFGSILGDIVKWGFLNAVITVPFTCAFWITFGAISLTPVNGYDSVGPLLYNIFSMMVVNDHGYENLEQANPVMARLLCGGFIGIAAIVTLNLLIALLTNTFERLYENAVANAVMQRAYTILLLQKSLTKKQKLKYYNFIRKKGSPEVISSDLGGVFSTERDERVTIERVREDISIIMGVLGEHFGKRFGKKKKRSALDFVKMDVIQVKRLQEELVNDLKSIKILLQEVEKVLELLAQQNNNIVDNSNNDDNNKSDNNNDDENNAIGKINTALSSWDSHHKIQSKRASIKEVTFKKTPSSESEDDSQSEESDIFSESFDELKSKTTSKDDRHRRSSTYGQGKRGEVPSTSKLPYPAENTHKRFSDEDELWNYRSEYVPARPQLVIQEPPLRSGHPPTTVQELPYGMRGPNGHTGYPPAHQYPMMQEIPNQLGRPGPSVHSSQYAPGHYQQPTINDRAYHLARIQHTRQELPYQPRHQQLQRQAYQQNPQFSYQENQQFAYYHSPAETAIRPLSANQEPAQENLSPIIQKLPYQSSQLQSTTQRPLQLQGHSQPINQPARYNLATPQSTAQKPEFPTRMSSEDHPPIHDQTDIASTVYPQHKQTASLQQAQSIENDQQQCEVVDYDIGSTDLAELEDAETEHTQNLEPSRFRSMSDSNVLIDHDHIQTSTPTADSRQQSILFPRERSQTYDFNFPHSRFQPISSHINKPPRIEVSTELGKSNLGYHHDSQAGDLENASQLQSIPGNTSQTENEYNTSSLTKTVDIIPRPATPMAPEIKEKVDFFQRIVDENNTTAQKSEGNLSPDTKQLVLNESQRQTGIEEDLSGAVSHEIDESPEESLASDLPESPQDGNFNVENEFLVNNEERDNND